MPFPVSKSVDPFGYGEGQLELEKIARRRKVAEALQAQSMTPGGDTQIVSGYAVKRSPFEGLAKVAQAYAGNKMQQQADQDWKSYNTKSREDIAGAMADFQHSTTPHEVQTPNYAGMTGGLDQQDIPTSPEMVNPDANAKRTAALTLAGRVGDPRQVAAALVADAMRVRDPIKLRENERLINPDTMKPLVNAEAPPPQPYSLSPDQVRYGPDNKPVAYAPSKPEKDEAAKFKALLEGAGIDPESPAGQKMFQALVAKTVTHQPGTNIKIDNKMGESLAKEVGPMMSQSHSSALGALDAVNTVGRIREAIDKGNVSLGPTATLRNTADQFAEVLGVAGKDTTERLVNTRQVIRGLAQFTISARKELKGQGQVSDFEGKLLQKAESGEIDNMTLPELKAFVDTTERLSRKQYEMHQQKLGVMNQREDLKGVAPFYAVPEMPVFKPPERRASDKTPKAVKFGDLP